MANDGTAIKTTVRMKGHPIKIIIDTRAIITYPIVKRLQLAMGPADGSQIIAIDQ